MIPMLHLTVSQIRIMEKLMFWETQLISKMLSSFAQFWVLSLWTKPWNKAFFLEKEKWIKWETKISIFNTFSIIEFETKDTSRSKLQAVKDYLDDVKNNAKEYNLVLFMTGVFSFNYLWKQGYKGNELFDSGTHSL